MIGVSQLRGRDGILWYDDMMMRSEYMNIVKYDQNITRCGMIWLFDENYASLHFQGYVPASYTSLPTTTRLWHASDMHDARWKMLVWYIQGVSQIGQMTHAIDMTSQPTHVYDQPTHYNKVVTCQWHAWCQMKNASVIYTGCISDLPDDTCNKYDQPAYPCIWPAYPPQ